MPICLICLLHTFLQFVARSLICASPHFTSDLYSVVGLSPPPYSSWSADLRLHTLHSHDLASGLWALAQWMAPLGRENTTTVSNPIPCLLASSETLPDGMPPRDAVVTAPFFNLVDDGDTTQGLMASLAESVVGVKTGFYGKIINQFAKVSQWFPNHFLLMPFLVSDHSDWFSLICWTWLKMSTPRYVCMSWACYSLHNRWHIPSYIVQHFEPWPEMLSKSMPPIINTPFTPTLPEALLSKHHIALDGTKIRQVIGWQPKFPKMTVAVIQDQLDKFKEEGVWPNAPPRGKK